MTQVRRMGRWMYTVDERILEHLAEESWASPSTMEVVPEFQQMDVDEKYINQRCKQLVERELIAPIAIEYDMFEITNLGLAYLRGDLDAECLPRWSIQIYK